MQVVREGERDFGRPLALLQSPLNLFLRGDADDDIPFDDRLASQRVASRHVVGGESLGGAAAHRPVFDDDGATTAPSLATARHQHVHAGLLCSIAQESTCGYLHSLVSGLKVNVDTADDYTPYP